MTLDWRSVLTQALMVAGIIDSDEQSFTGKIIISMEHGGVRFIEMTETIK